MITNFRNQFSVRYNFIFQRPTHCMEMLKKRTGNGIADRLKIEITFMIPFLHQ